MGLIKITSLDTMENKGDPVNGIWFTSWLEQVRST